MSLFISSTAPAQECFDWPKIFKANRELFDSKPQSKRILVLPFINKTYDLKLQWLSDAFRIGLILMLENSKNTDAIEKRSLQTTFNPKEAITLGKQAKADYVIAGQYHLQKKNNFLKVYTLFVDVKSGDSFPIEEELLEWPNPQKYAELMVHLARRASKAFKNVRIEKKFINALMNKARSVDSLQFWVLGQIAAAKGTPRDIGEAHKNYQESIKKDFNYCYGYMGLAQSFAETGFIEKISKRPYKRLYHMAQKELTKVTLLCPEVAALWGGRIAQYLEADVLHLKGVDLQQKGQGAAAQAAFKQAIELLPGDIPSLQQLGSGDLAELTRCGGKTP